MLNVLWIVLGWQAKEALEAELAGARSQLDKARTEMVSVKATVEQLLSTEAQVRTVLPDMFAIDVFLRSRVLSPTKPYVHWKHVCVYYGLKIALRCLELH